MIENHQAATRVVMWPRLSWFRNVWLVGAGLAWLIVEVCLTVLFVDFLFSSGHLPYGMGNAILGMTVVVLGIWTLPGIWLLGSLKRALADQLILEVDPRTITLVHIVGPWDFSTALELKDCRALRAHHLKERSSWFMKGLDLYPNMIHFDHGKSTIGCACGMTEAEAQTIVEAVGTRHPELVA